MGEPAIDPSGRARLDRLAWPRERLGDALTALARRIAPHRRAPALVNPPAELATPGEVARWIRAAAEHVGLDALPADARATTLASLAPRDVAVLVRSGDRLLLIARRGRTPGTVVAIDPAQEDHELPAAAVDRWLDGTPERAAATSLGAAAGLTAAETASLRGLLGAAPARPTEAWLLDAASPRFGERLRQAGGRRLLGRVLLGRAAELTAFASAWALIARGALEGRLEAGWLYAWAGLLLTVAVARAVAGWAAARLAVTVGGLTREQLLDGILRLPADVVRRSGVGQLLGAVLEAESLASLARGAGALAFTGLFELVLGAVVLGLGAAPGLQLAALLVWLGVAAVAVRRLYARLVDWADGRLRLTEELVEEMVGHRTVVAQLPPERRDEAAARTLDAYERRAALFDGAATRVLAILPRGWLLLGLAALLPGFVVARTPSPGLGVTLGGVLLVHLALRRLADVAPALAAALVGWRRTRPLFRAATPDADAPAPLLPTAPDEVAAGRRGLLVARDVSFRYDGRPEPVLRSCTFSIARGDRVLLQGPSGGGKSTLGALLGGLRQPSSGVLLLGGFDHHTLRAERWRQRATAVPQFHENHVLAAPFLFNVLMGRAWPPRLEDLREAEAVCTALGLDDVLARMPAGMQQMIGDSGWQLSHGERARLYVARALLQPVDLRVLDESFSCLDPLTFEKVLDAVLARTETLVVIEHG